MKYKIKDKKPLKVIKHPQVCIRCGKTKTYEQFIYSNAPPRPRPNTTVYIGQPSMMQCMLGQHYYYFRDEVESSSR